MAAPGPAVHEVSPTRVIVGLLCALSGILLAVPAPLGPWAHALQRWLSVADAGGPPVALVVHTLVPVVLVASLLLIGGLVLPPLRPATPPRPALLPFGLGLLLLAEPALHLALLLLLAGAQWPGGTDLLLPPPVHLPAWVRVAQALVIIGIAPAAEELFFRGRLVPLLGRTLGPVSAVTLSALAFACAHGNPCQALVALPVGLLLGWVRVRGASLAACVLIHQAHNALFFIGGAEVIAAPYAAVALALGGTACLVLAAVWPQGGFAPRRPGVVVLVALVGAGLLLAGVPRYQRLQDRWWLEAIHRVVIGTRLDDALLLQRLEFQRYRGRWEYARCHELAVLLRARPPGSALRRTWVLALLEPEAMSAPDDVQARASLEDLASCPFAYPSLACAAVRLGSDHPAAFAITVVNDPDILLRWLPMPDACADLATLLGAGSPRDRQLLLAACEHCYPSKVLPALLTLPPHLVTRTERTFVRRYYAPERVQRLLQALPAEQAAAWAEPIERAPGAAP